MKKIEAIIKRSNYTIIADNLNSMGYTIIDKRNLEDNQFFDKQKDCSYSVYQQLIISGMRNFSTPSNGKLIIEGNDGSMAIYWDKDSDGIYETTSIFGAPKSNK